jgi:hypothetical protein
LAARRGDSISRSGASHKNRPGKHQRADDADHRRAGFMILGEGTHAIALEKNRRRLIREVQQSLEA